jgi:hypothetical protein
MISFGILGEVFIKNPFFPWFYRQRETRFCSHSCPASPCKDARDEKRRKKVFSLNEFFKISL